MSDAMEWHQVYDRPTLFAAGVAVGDVYRSRGGEGPIWRVRLWRENRLQGGDEKLILASAGEETAKQVLEGMYASARRNAGE
jgi:hypothetical protein